VHVFMCFCNCIYVRVILNYVYALTRARVCVLIHLVICSYMHLCYREKDGGPSECSSVVRSRTCSRRGSISLNISFPQCGSGVKTGSCAWWKLTCDGACPKTPTLAIHCWRVYPKLTGINILSYIRYKYAIHTAIGSAHADDVTMYTAVFFLY
jgi:hypothetical protein